METSRVKAYLAHFADDADAPPAPTPIRRGGPSIVSQMRQAVSGDG